MTRPSDLEALAESVGALDRHVSSNERRRRLEDALRRGRLEHQATIVRADGDEILALVKESDDARAWTEVVLRARSAAPRPENRDAALGRSLDDASVRLVADVLEAKYRADEWRKHYLGGMPDDPNVFHDGVDLAFRTWREALTLSIRAQRAFLRSAREVLPQPPRRPVAITRVSGPVRMRFGERAWEGRFTVRNDRGTLLEATLGARLDGADVALTPNRLRLRPKESAVVIVCVRTPTTPPRQVELEWTTDVPFDPLTLEFATDPRAEGSR